MRLRVRYLRSSAEWRVVNASSSFVNIASASSESSVRESDWKTKRNVRLALPAGMFLPL